MSEESEEKKILKENKAKEKAERLKIIVILAMLKCCNTFFIFHCATASKKISSTQNLIEELTLYLPYCQHQIYRWPKN